MKYRSWVEVEPSHKVLEGKVGQVYRTEEKQVLYICESDQAYEVKVERVWRAEKLDWQL